MKFLPTLGMKQVFQDRGKRLRSGKIQSFFPNIFKIKDKILANIFVASQNG